MPKPYEEHFKKARFQYNAAFHLLNVTSPLIKDPRLLIGIATNLLNSFEASMDCLLTYDQEQAKIGAYPPNFTSKFTHFRAKSVPRHNISPKIIQLIISLKELVDLHQKSPTEFQRGNRFVICNEQFSFKTLSAQDLKEYLTQTKVFLDHIEPLFKPKHNKSTPF